MGEKTKIEWATHSWNPWIGCSKVSPGCANCYAEAMMDKRFGKVNWGPGNPRVRTSAANWKQVEKWNRALAEINDINPGMVPIRERVFCASLADWLDPEGHIEWLADLLDLIRRCPHLDFLLLTKRPELWRRRMGEVWHDAANYWRENFGEGFAEWMRAWTQDLASPEAPHNIWMGTSVEDQKRADDRIPALLEIPARVRFLSCEPLLGPVDIEIQLSDGEDWLIDEGIHWVICGGESGPNAREMRPEWALNLRDQCQESGVPFFFKQMTKKAPIPDDLMIREFPNAR